MDIISPGLSSQEKIGRKIFGCKLLLWGDLREHKVFHKTTQGSEKAHSAPENFALKRTKPDPY
ncbi:hypothetical protein SBA3_2050011 [Candidatus Sulfopaludibacter sp. SbA3]|nr:hypothetical protein SBA3_2050011 [Candidatus Sulfopaludibacter sp. SbA3]